MGAADMLRAWSAMLADQRDTVPFVCGNEEDVIENMDNNPSPQIQAPFIMQNKQLKGFSMLAFGLRYMWDLLVRRNKETHILYLPKAFITKLHQTAQDQLSSVGDTEKPLFISDGDLITAWLSRLIISSRSTKRPAILMNVFDVRGRLKDCFKSGAVYLQNLILPATVYLPATENASTSFGQIAFRLRKALIEQTSDSQARSLVGLMKATVASTDPCLCSEVGTRWLLLVLIGPRLDLEKR
ncbi:MAG: hypothetical protein Q9183_002230 [Haloplaca sp. 2 TL-2023]